MWHLINKPFCFYFFFFISFFLCFSFTTTQTRPAELSSITIKSLCRVSNYSIYNGRRIGLEKFRMIRRKRKNQELKRKEAIKSEKEKKILVSIYSNR